jgi:hypothetical protein
VELARTARSREHWLVLLGALALPIVLLVLGGMLHPDSRGFGTHEQLGFKPCLPMRLWNFPCPGCGVTTSIALAAHGRPLAALRTQPFGPIVLATALAVAVWALAGHARGRDLRGELALVRQRRWTRMLVTLALLAWAYKIALVRGWLG